MAWTSPAGFPWFMRREPKEVRLATADSTIIIYEDDPARKIDWRKAGGRQSSLTCVILSMPHT